jgi:hypothetical protein
LVDRSRHKIGLTGKSDDTSELRLLLLLLLLPSNAGLPDFSLYNIPK